MKQQTAAELFKEAEKKAKSWNFSLFGFGNGSSAKWEHAGWFFLLLFYGTFFFPLSPFFSRGPLCEGGQPVQSGKKG
jgi:hypothetical protein